MKRLLSRVLLRRSSKKAFQLYSIPLAAAVIIRNSTFSHCYFNNNIEQQLQPCLPDVSVEKHNPTMIRQIISMWQ